jgi:hypothetical protein
MQSTVNMLMVEYEENVNLVAKINTELCKQFGLEHHLTDFSANLVNALNQYKRFVMLMKDRKLFVKKILAFSNACISFFEKNDGFKEPKATIKKMNILVNDLNEINELINKSSADSVKDYLKDD